MAEPPPTTASDADKTPAPLALPPSQPLPSDATSNSSGSSGEQGVRTITITVDGALVKLDHLGPIIINTDGTVARISNWQELSEGEQSVALRRIAKRNKARVQQLTDGQDGGGAEEK
jgi:hypothetical protein